MAWRILLVALYAGIFGAVVALENSSPGMSDVPALVLWLMAPVVGFLVGRWWVLLAVVGVIVGRTVGWDPGENDGNPALWPPYVVMTIIFVGLPLLLGVAASQALQSRRSQPSRLG
jgi:hypothetical protein